MTIHTLLIEEDGIVTANHVFSDHLSILHGTTDSLTGEILSLLISGRETPSRYAGAVRFFATVSLPALMFVRGEKDSGDVRFHLTATAAGSDEDDTAVFYQTIRQSHENDLQFFSDFRRADYPHRLCAYKDPALCDTDGTHAALTEGFSRTRCFRKLTNDYIRQFAPVRLREGKDCYLNLLKDGSFAALNKEGQPLGGMSESENVLYHCHCFLHLANFWTKAQAVRDLHQHPFPLILSDLLERLDESIDVSDLLAKANALEQQVFLFDGGHP